MRYLEAENPYIIVRFTTGDTVTIDIYDLADDSKDVDGVSMTEIGATGFFKYLFNPSVSTLMEYLYVASNSIEEHAGKIILGGYPDAILDDTGELQGNQSNWLTATGFATSTALTTVDANVDAISVQITALNDFNPLTDTVANVTLVDTTTTNTDNVVPDNASITAIKNNLIIRSGTVSSVISNHLEFCTDLSEATDYWTRGAIRWTSGNNEGVIRKIQLYSTSSGYIKLRTELINTIQPNDTFDIIPVRAFRINHEDVEQIVDETLDELLSGHTIVGSLGEKIQDISDHATELQGNQSNWLTATGFATSGALATVDANVDAILVHTTELQGNQSNWLTATGFSTYDPEVDIVEGSVTYKQSMQLSNAASAGKASGMNTATVSIRDLGDTKDTITATVDRYGNRSGVVIDVG